MDIVPSLRSIIDKFRPFYIGKASPVDKNGFIVLNGIKAQVVGGAISNDIIIRDTKTGKWIAFVQEIGNKVLRTTSIKLYQSDPLPANDIRVYFIGYAVEALVEIPPPEGILVPVYHPEILTVADFKESRGDIIFGMFAPYYRDIPWILEIPSLPIPGLEEEQPFLEYLYLWGKETLPHKPLSTGNASFLSSELTVEGEAYTDWRMQIIQSSEAGSVQAFIQSVNKQNPPLYSLLQFHVQDSTASKFSMIFRKRGKTIAGEAYGYEGVPRSFAIGFEAREEKEYGVFQSLYLHRFTLKSGAVKECLTDYPLSLYKFPSLPSPTFVESFGETAPTAPSRTGTLCYSGIYTDGVLTTVGFNSEGIALARRWWTVSFQWHTQLTQSAVRFFSSQGIGSELDPTNNRITIALDQELLDLKFWEPSFPEEVPLVYSESTVLSVPTLSPFTETSPFLRFTEGSNLVFSVTYFFKWGSHSQEEVLQVQWEDSVVPSRWVEFNVTRIPELGTDNLYREILTIRSYEGVLLEEESSTAVGAEDPSSLRIRWEISLYWKNPVTETRATEYWIPQINDDQWVDSFSYRINREEVVEGYFSEEIEFYTNLADPVELYDPYESETPRTLKSPFLAKGNTSNLRLLIGSRIDPSLVLLEHYRPYWFTGYHNGISPADYPFLPHKFLLALSYRWSRYDPEPIEETFMQERIFIELHREKVGEVVHTNCYRSVSSQPGADILRASLTSRTTNRWIKMDGDPLLYLPIMKYPTSSSSFSTDGRLILDFPKYSLAWGSDDFLKISDSEGAGGLVLPVAGYTIPLTVSVASSKIKGSPDATYTETFSVDIWTDIPPWTLYKEFIRVKNKDGIVIFEHESPYLAVDLSTVNSALTIPGSSDLYSGAVRAYDPEATVDPSSNVYLAGTSVELMTVKEGGYELLFGKKFRGSSPFISFNEPVTSFLLDRDPSNVLVEKNTGLFHLSLFSNEEKTIALNIPETELDEVTVSCRGIVLFKGINFYPYLAPLSFEAVIADLYLSGYIEYCQGTIFDYSSGIIRQAVSIFFGKGSIEPGVDERLIDFEVLLIDKGSEMPDVIFRYKKEKFYDNTLINISSFFENVDYPAARLPIIDWDTSGYNTGFNEQLDYEVIDGVSGKGLAAVGIDVESASSRTFIHPASAKRSTLSLNTLSLGTRRVGDFVFNISPNPADISDLIVSSSNNIFLFNAGDQSEDGSTVIRQVISPFSFDSFFGFIRLDQGTQTIEGNPTSVQTITFYMGQETGRPTKDEESSYPVPIFSATTKITDPLGRPVFQDKSGFLRKIQK